MDEKVGREDFLHALESVTPGLSPKEVIKQSSCFVFAGGRVHSYNEMTACSAPSLLPKEVTGAVHAKPLIKALSQLVDDAVRVKVTDKKLIVKGHKREIGVIMEAEVVLPYASVPRPERWSPLHESFSDALSIVQECAGKDTKYFLATCVHVNPRFLEAFDNCQLCRYKIKCGVKEACLVERESLKHVVASGVDEVAESPAWLHFRSPDGLEISCRRFLEQFPEIGHAFDVEGEAVELPRSLPESVDLADVFASEDKDGGLVVVTVKSGEMTLLGEGVTGYALDRQEVAYHGKDMTFAVAPKLLKSIAEKSSRCVMASDRLMVDGGTWRYVTVLQVPEEK